MRVLIGTAAWEKALPPGKSLPRPVKDLDFLVTSEERRGPGEDFISGDSILEAYEFKTDHVSLDELLTVKLSHSFWVVTDLLSWSKHVKDIHVLRRQGAVVKEDLYSLAYSHWEGVFGPKSVKLDQTREDFFNNSVDRYYVHDSIHASVALGGSPGFEKILRDDSEVAVSRAKFEALDETVKARLVFEEVMVLSLERDLIPLAHSSGVEPDREAIYRSYSKQLRLLITQYSKGWFPRWVVENYHLVATPPLNYWRMFEESDRKVRL